MPSLLHASSTDDFYEALEPAYSKLLRAGESDTLEVALAASVYDDLGLTLIDFDGRGNVGLIVRAADTTQPPTFVANGVQLSGRDIRLDGLVFKDGQPNNALITIQARTNVVIERCAIIDAMRGAWPTGASLMEITASTYADSVSVRDSWFIGCRENNPSTLLSFAGLPHQNFQRITFENVAFIDNRLTTGIMPGAADEVIFKNCFIHAPINFVTVTYGATEVSFEDCHLVAENIDDLVRFLPAEARDDDVTFRGTRLYLKQPFGTERGFRIIGTQQHSAQRPFDVDTFAAQFSALAAQGLIPDSAALRSAYLR